MNQNSHLKASSDVNGLEGSFVEEGRGNGSLHPRVVRDPVNFWEGGACEDDFSVGYDFHPNDFEALYYEALGVPRWEDISAQGFEEQDELCYKGFVEHTLAYPLLNRINDMYQDAAYSAEEVLLLRDQCRELQASIVNEQASRALSKIILACDKATEKEMGLLFISD